MRELQRQAGALYWPRVPLGLGHRHGAFKTGTLQHGRAAATLKDNTTGETATYTLFDDVWLS
jgi:hypothetical protein